MEQMTLQQLINQTREALIEAGASNYYQIIPCRLKSSRRNGVQPIL